MSIIDGIKLDELRDKAALADKAQAENKRLRAALTEARSFVEGMVSPVKSGVIQISSYHPCHALIDKINAALASDA